MIITLTGANFSASNIGTLSTWSISRVIGSGATYAGPAYVNKNAALNATVTIADGYELGSAGVTVTMGGVTQSGVTTTSEDGKIVTISIGSVSGNVVIKVPTKNINTGEEDDGVKPTIYTLSDIQSSLSMYQAEEEGSNTANSFANPVTTLESNYISFVTSSQSKCLFSNIPLGVGSEVEFSVVYGSVNNSNCVIGFTSTIDNLDTWKNMNWQENNTGVVIPDSHIWFSKDGNIIYLERLTNKFVAATPATAINSFLPFDEGRKCKLKVLATGFEFYNEAGNLVFTMTSNNSNPYITHTTTPVYFCFSSDTSMTLKIYSIKQVV